MTTKAVRATIKIADIGLEVFQLPSGEYVMSQTQVVEAVEAPKTSIIRFLRSSEALALLEETSELSTLHVEGSAKPINVVPIDAISRFWFDQAIKGNPKSEALTKACLKEALDRRCDNAFGITKTDEQYEQQTSVWLEEWRNTRGYLKDTHMSFERTCDACGFPRAQTHDALTMAVCKKKASQLKKIGDAIGSKDIGLNHIKDIRMLWRVARVKIHFSSYRGGNVNARIDRALKALQKEEKTLKVTSNN